MAVWTDFYDDVLPEVPGVTVALAERQIKKAALEFITRSGLLHKTITAIDHPGGAVAVDLQTKLQSNEILVRLMGVWYQDRPLTLTSAESLAQEMPDWMSRTGTPEFYLVEGLTNLWTPPSPATVQVGALKARVVYGLDYSATSIPDAVFKLYREEIAYGAKSRLMAMPKKPWTDMALAGAYLATYTQAINSAAVRAGTPAGAPLRVPSRGF